MKSVNRKLFLSLLGIAVATPFLVIALVVGMRATALAHSLQGDLVVVVLALASVVAGIGEGRIVLRREGAPATCGDDERETDLRGVSTLHHGC